jgi:hypothetical protein
VSATFDVGDICWVELGESAPFVLEPIVDIVAESSGLAALVAVNLGFGGDGGSRDPSRFLYQLLRGSSRHSPTVTASNSFEVSDRSIIPVTLLPVSELISWSMTSQLWSTGFERSEKIELKPFIDA